MNELTPFAFWCQKVMPAVLDDSLSFYEVLCKLTAKLNAAIETINGHSELITTMQSEIDALQTLTAQHTQQIADLTKKVQTNANNITAINTRTKGLSTKTDSANNWFGLNLQTDDNYVYRLAWSTDAPAASVLQTSRPGSVYYQIGGPQDDWTWAHVQNSTEGTQPAFTSISRTIYNQITSDINDVESSAAQNAQAIKMLQDLTSDHSTAISSLQDSVGKNTQAITDLNKGLSNTNQTVAKLESSLETLDTRTKGISTNVSGDGDWYGITLNTDTNLNYRIAWCNNPTEEILSTSSRGSVYLFNQGISSLTGVMGWSQIATNSTAAWYKGLANDSITGINNQISTLTTTVTNINNRTKGLQTKTGNADGWQGFTIDTDDGNHYRLAWIDGDPAKSILGTSSAGSIYLYKQSVSSSSYLYGWSQNSATERSVLYNGVPKTTIDTVNNKIKTLQTNLTLTTNTMNQLGNLANEINTRTKGISTKTDSSDNWIGISLSTDDSYIYRVAWSNETPALPVLQQSRPGSLYLRIGGPAPDIWLYAWDQDGTDTAMPLVTEKI